MQARGQVDARDGLGGHLETQGDAHHASRQRASSSTVPQVERRFEAEAPDQLWVADITYVPTWAGFVFLAVVVDAFSRRVVGWSMASHLRTELVLEALNMALWQRRPDSVVHHSDSEYVRAGALRWSDPHSD